MAEFCLDCWNKLMGTDDTSEKYIISRDLDLCEACGKRKRVIIRIRWKYIVSEWFREQKECYKKMKNS